MKRPAKPKVGNAVTAASDVPDATTAGELAATFKGRKPIVEVTDNNGVNIKVNARQGDKPLGSDDERFIFGLIEQVTNAASKGSELNKPRSEFALSVIQAIDPRDEVEAMLAAQMAAVHMATMTFARRLNNVETIPQQDSAGSLLNKLARTYAAQAEALKKYRSGGEQRITVQHVTVNDGGQAVVGNVSTGRTADREGGNGKS